MTWRRSSAVLGLVLAALFLGPSTLRATGNLETVTQSGSAIASVAWDSSLIPIPWYFNNPSTVSGCSYNSPNAPASALQPAIAAAFATWQANPLSTQSYTYAGTTTVRNVGADGLNVVTFCDLVVLGSDQGYLARTPTTALTQQMTVTAGGGCPSGQGLLDLNGPPNPPGFCFPVGTYPAGTIVDSDVEYNTYSTNEQDFSTNHTAGTYDIQALTTHELGHFIGLSHDPLSDSVMYAYADDEPPSDGVGQRVLKEPDLTTAGRYYPSAQFQADRGSITGIITLDGARADGVHVVAIDPNTLRGVSGRFSVSRFEDSTILYGPEGADFAANGAGHYRIDGLAPGAYYVYVEYFDGSEFWSDRLANHYNTTVGNSNVSNGSSTSSGQVGGWLGFLPKLAEFYDSSESGNGGDGMNPGT
ncbi:MAG TPA: matrixin family metalloprotease, partial [Candidatus Saccharimonadales bacterium]|nr:matrixin family metalloprotease [Candidatus Saccharimonadales bacterium]